MKEMTITIPLSDKCDTKTRVKDLIMSLLEVCGDNYFSIDSVEIDNQKVFGAINPTGFVNEYFK